jgi:hypothetical protein
MPRVAAIFLPNVRAFGARLGRQIVRLRANDA